MDEIDLQILQTLQKDGRTPFTKIAKRTGVSESTIRTRYASLVQEGIVNTVSIVDPFALNFQAPAVVGISVEAGMIDQVGKQIQSYPEVSYEVMVLGTYDLIVEVFCKDLNHLVDFVTNILQKVPGVKKTETLMIAKTYKLSYRWSPELEINEND
jgi:Lrp/AsnC family transcriptional regulator for asnA, asnC and gidA